MNGSGAAMAEMRVGGAGAPALGGLVALAVAMGIGRFVYTPILPAMVAELGLSGFAAGLIASANFLGYLLGAVLATGARLPGSRRRWMFVGLVLSTATTAAMGVTASMPAFLVLRFLGGGASAFVLVFGAALIMELGARRGRPAWGAVMFAGVGTGIAVSAALVTWLRASGLGWQVLWLANGAVSALGAAVAMRLVPPDPPANAAGRGTGQGAADSTHGRGLAALVVAYGLFGFGYVITMTFLVVIVRASPAIRAFEPLIWIVVGLSAAPSSLLWNRAAARLGSGQAFAAACVIEAVGVLASVFWPSLAGVLVAGILVGGTFVGVTALGLARARELARGDTHRVLGVMTVAFSLGQILGPSFAGFLADRLGGYAVPSAVAALALVVAAAMTARKGA